MFESKERLGKEIVELLHVLRELGEGRIACAMEPGRVLFEAPAEDERQGWALRRFLEEKSEAVFGLPHALESGAGPEHDVFADWDDEFFVAVVNGRVAVVVACAQAESVEERGGRALKALTDRLLRFNETWRLDAQGRGLFFGRAKLDMVVVGGQGAR